MKNILFAFSLMIPVMTAMLFTQCTGETKAATTVDDAIVVKTQPIATTGYTPQLSYSGSMASTSEARLSFKIGGIMLKAKSMFFIISYLKFIGSSGIFQFGRSCQCRQLCQ